MTRNQADQASTPPRIVCKKEEFIGNNATGLQ
jgi:hypothetical protein